MNESTEQTDIPKKPLRRKYIISAGFILLLIIMVLVFSLLQIEPKPDPESEKLIRAVAALKLHKDPNKLTDEDFAKITSFGLSLFSPEEIKYPEQGGLFIYSGHIDDLELADINLLEKFTNLQKLSLTSISFPKKNIPKWMKILAKYGIYNLNERFSIDLSPLEKLSNLESLTLSGVSISSIEPLKQLKNLHFIQLNGCEQLSDIEPLKRLNNLQELSIDGCPKITDEQMDDLWKALPNLKISK